MNIRYLTDTKGSKTAVVIPIKDWEKYSRNLQELQQLLKMKYNLKTGISDFIDSGIGKKKQVTFKNFLNEI